MTCRLLGASSFISFHSFIFTLFFFFIYFIFISFIFIDREACIRAYFHRYAFLLQSDQQIGENVLQGSLQRVYENYNGTMSV